MHLIDTYWCKVMKKKFIIFFDKTNEIFVIQTRNFNTLFTTTSLKLAKDCCREFHNSDFIGTHVVNPLQERITT